MAIVLRDKTTPSQQAAIQSDGSLLIQPQALTKGNQGTNGFTVQNLIDAGRVAIGWTVSQFQFTAATDALLTVTESRDGAATTTFTSKVITSGKRLRLQACHLTYEFAGTTVANLRPIYVRIRINTAGAATTASPLVCTLGVAPDVVYSTAAILLGGGVSQEYTFPDGFEFLGDGTKQIGITAIAPGWVTTTTLPILTMSIVGFEY
jgi:hypothetical protein